MASWFRPETRMGIKKILLALEEGAKGAIGVGAACAVIGIIIGTVSLTGLGLSFGYSIMEYTNESLFLAALLVMIMSIILGMGVPGVAAYVIVAAVSVPVLTELGVEPLAAHMFVLIYACLSNVTPPVALASFVAAGIANTDQTKVSLTAVKLALTGFILPFFFIFQPALLISMENPGESILPTITASIGVISFAAGLQGWFLTSVSIIERILFITAGVFMIEPGIVTDMVGVGILLISVISQVIKRKRERRSNFTEDRKINY